MKNKTVKDYKGVKKNILDWQSGAVARSQFVSQDLGVINTRDTRNTRINKKGFQKMTGTTTSISIEHGMGYTPVILAFAYIGGSTAISNRWIKLPYFVNDGVSNPEIRVSITNRVLNIFRNFTSVDVSFFYLVLREKIE